VKERYVDREHTATEAGGRREVAGAVGAVGAGCRQREDKRQERRRVGREFSVGTT
jgi:hypothetical protein